MTPKNDKKLAGFEKVVVHTRWLFSSNSKENVLPQPAIHKISITHITFSKGSSNSSRFNRKKKLIKVLNKVKNHV